MYLESTGFGKIKEHFSTTDTWNFEIISMIIIYILWLAIWIFTIVSAIKLAKANVRNSDIGLLVSVVSWPFFWLFKFTGAIGKN